MQFRTFCVSALTDEGASELNAFLRSHRILSVDKQMSEQENKWLFCVQYLATNEGSNSERRSKVDDPGLFEYFGGRGEYATQRNEERKGFFLCALRSFALSSLTESARCFGQDSRTCFPTYTFGRMLTDS